MAASPAWQAVCKPLGGMDPNNVAAATLHLGLHHEQQPAFGSDLRPHVQLPFLYSMPGVVPTLWLAPSPQQSLAVGSYCAYIQTDVVNHLVNGRLATGALTGIGDVCLLACVLDKLLYCKRLCGCILPTGGLQASVWLHSPKNLFPGAHTVPCTVGAGVTCWRCNGASTTLLGRAHAGLPTAVCIRCPIAGGAMRKGATSTQRKRWQAARDAALGLQPLPLPW